MKYLARIFFGLCILSLIVRPSFCQTAPDIIPVDFLNIPALPTYKNVTYNHKYVMKIENINRSLFKVESSIGQQDYNTALPDVFKGIKLPGYFSFTLPNSPPDKIAAAAGLTVEKSFEGRDYRALIKNKLDSINTSNKRILATAEYNNNLKNLFNACDKAYDEIEKILIDQTSTFLTLNLKDRKSQADSLRTNLISFIQSAILANEELDILVQLHLASIDGILRRNTSNVISDWEKTTKNKKDNEYNIELLRYDSAKGDNESLSNYKDSLKAVVAKASESVNEMKKFRDENKIQELVDNYNMINKSNFTFISESIKVKSDEVKFDIKITSDKQLPCDIPMLVKISETYKTTGGCKVDFSTGIFFMGGDVDFLGRELQYTNVNDSVVTIQSKLGGKRALMSVGALMHFYKRGVSNFHLAFSPGLSTTTALDGINFHFGGSLIFGGENRGVFSVGIILKESKILDKNYSLNKEYSKSDLPDSPPTIKVFPQFGGFVGLTYNFSKFKSE